MYIQIWSGYEILCDVVELEIQDTTGPSWELMPLTLDVGPWEIFLVHEDKGPLLSSEHIYTNKRTKPKKLLHFLARIL